ncbi:hypothetical protein NDU88_011100 [Pleurodeles waltl]|uniref:Uncharacterized protein n=1 Tax=Pleurodeles waltl TaxID=8319 RepID=A0AAV7Q0T4_PLEWA|nr:hypothetical protein NDU88_011100 [Pleurodeles waltl]
MKPVPRPSPYCALQHQEDSGGAFPFGPCNGISFLPWTLHQLHLLVSAHPPQRHPGPICRLRPLAAQFRILLGQWRSRPVYPQLPDLMFFF